MRSHHCVVLATALAVVQHASRSEAQSVAPAPAVAATGAPLAVGPSAVTDPSPLERYAASRGFGVAPRVQQPPTWWRTLQQAAKTDNVEQPPLGRVTCPMPVANVDPKTLEPMPVATVDSAAFAPSTRTGVIAGCDNPLWR